MNARKAISFAFALVLALALYMPAARADVRNQETQFIFNNPVQLPGNLVLPAGTYWFKLADSVFDPSNVVRIMDANKTLTASVVTEPTERVMPLYSGRTDAEWSRTGLNFAETSDQPDTLVKWFYPGDQVGHEFVYSGPQEKQLSEEETVTVMVGPNGNVPASSPSATSGF